MDFKLCLYSIIVLIWAMVPANSSDPNSRFLTSKEQWNILKYLGGSTNLGPNLTEGEKSALQEFKAVVDAARDHLPREESYDEQFLLRFLSANNFVVEEAFQVLLDHMIWRQTMDIDSIQEPDFSDLKERYPYGKFLLRSTDFQDGVILYIPICKWNLQDFILTNQPMKDAALFLRYSYKMMEDVSHYARLVAGVLKLTGRDSSKFHIVVDMNDCRVDQGEIDVTALVELVEHFGRYYKEATKHVIFTNVQNEAILTCAWSTKGILTCPIESPETGEDILEGEEVLSLV